MLVSEDVIVRYAKHFLILERVQEIYSYTKARCLYEENKGEEKRTFVYNDVCLEEFGPSPHTQPPARRQYLRGACVVG